MMPTVTMPIQAATGILAQVKEISPLTLCILGIIAFGALNAWTAQKVTDVVQANTVAMTQVVSATQAQAAYNVHLDAQVQKLLQSQDQVLQALQARQR